MIHKSLAETSVGRIVIPTKSCGALARGSEEGGGERGDRRRGVPIGIDNPNFSVINRSPVHGTWCTKSLRASDVIGIYWPENWDALSPPELHVPSFLIFLPRLLPAPPVSAKPPFYIHSLSSPFSPFFQTWLLFFSRRAMLSVHPNSSVSSSSVPVQGISERAKCSFHHAHTRGKFKESVAT